MNRRTRAVVAVAVVAAAFAAGAHGADAYPAKPVRFLVGSAPGSGTDTVSRAVAQKLTERLGQSVIVENRPGAGGTVAAAAVARAAPDGYALHFTSGALAVHPAIYRKLAYDVARDFAPVSLIGIVPQVLVVHPSLPARNVRELIALARARPLQINYGSGGVGATNHLAAELLQTLAGIKLTHVPYKGAGAAMVDLIAGQVQMLFTSAVNALQHTRAGRVRALAVSTSTRSTAMPGLPTIAEAGVPGYESKTWYGLVGPAGMPRAAVERLNREIAAVVRLPDVLPRLEADGVEPGGGTPEQFAEMLRAEIARIAKIAKAAGIEPQ